MKRFTVVIIALVLALSLVMPSVALAQTESCRETGNDLQIMKMPAKITGNPHDDAAPMVKPDNPGKPPKPDPEPDPEPEPAANKWALVVGIADYEGRTSDLWNPDDDAKEMAKALEQNYGFAESNIRLLTNRNATASNIVSGINWLLQNEDAESTVVIFFSGHGFTLADSEGWDSDVESDGIDEGIVTHDFYGITDGNLKDMLSGLESEKVFMGFASCHSGGMFDDDNDGNGLQGTNRVIATACQADQYGWDIRTLKNTVWGKYFVDEPLLQGLGDANSDGTVSIEEAHAYAYARVPNVVSDSTPQLYDNYAGDMLL